MEGPLELMTEFSDEDMQIAKYNTAVLECKITLTSMIPLYH